jgi:hypothetical protein
MEKMSLLALRREVQSAFWLVAATISCITYKPSLCDLENLSNDAKGEDE